MAMHAKPLQLPLSSHRDYTTRLPRGSICTGAHSFLGPHTALALGLILFPFAFSLCLFTLPT